MNKNLLFIAMFAFVLALSGSVFAVGSANTVAVHVADAGNCSATILSSAVLTSQINATQGFQYKITINVSTNDTTLVGTCRVAITTFKNVTQSSDNKKIIVSHTNGTLVNITSNISDSNGRIEINFTSVLLKSNLSTDRYNITFNFSSGLTKQTNNTQRLIAQKLFSINNVAEIDIPNLYSDVVYYYDWSPSVLTAYECTSDMNCNNTAGNFSGKSEIAGVTSNFINDTTNYIIRVKDSNSTKSSVSNYSLEGYLIPASDPDESYPQDAQPTGGAVTTQPIQTVSSSPVAVITTGASGIASTVTSKSFMQSTPLFLPNWLWIVIIVLVIVALVVWKLGKK